jgi:hypothetical protein
VIPSGVDVVRAMLMVYEALAVQELQPALTSCLLQLGSWLRLVVTMWIDRWTFRVRR